MDVFYDWIDKKIENNGLFYFLDWSPIPCSPFVISASKGKSFISNPCLNEFKEYLSDNKLEYDTDLLEEDIIHKNMSITDVDNNSLNSSVFCIQYSINTTGIFLFRLAIYNKADGSEYTFREVFYLAREVTRDIKLRRSRIYGGYPPSLSANLENSYSPDHYVQPIMPICDDKSECFFKMLSKDNFYKLENFHIYKGGIYPEKNQALVEIRKQYVYVKDTAIDYVNRLKREVEYKKSIAIYLLSLFTSIILFHLYVTIPQDVISSINAIKNIFDSEFNNAWHITKNAIQDAPILTGILFSICIYGLYNIYSWLSKGYSFRLYHEVREKWLQFRDSINGISNVKMHIIIVLLLYAYIKITGVFDFKLLTENFIPFSFAIVGWYVFVYLYEIEFKRSRIIRALYENKYFLLSHEPFSQVLKDYFYTDKNHSEYSASVNNLDVRIKHEEMRLQRVREVLRMFGAVLAIVLAISSRYVFNGST